MEAAQVTRKIDDYTLGPLLGKGFFGHVRVATKGGDATKYALKYMKLDDPSAKSMLIQTLRQECTLQKFNHPNILHIYFASANGVYERVKEGGTKRSPVLYLVLQLARSGDLFDFVTSSGGLSERIARLYFTQVLSALEHVHSVGIAHRDIKPENILLDQNYNALVTDFGLSKKLSELGFFTADPANRVGTERCMSPELFAGKGHSPVKDDLFGLGYLLFMLVARHPPFLLPSSANEHYRMLMENNIKDYWKAIDSLHPPLWCSDEFRHLVTIMLSFDMTIRPSISEIKSHPWTGGELPTETEVITEFEKRQSLAIEYQKKEARYRKQRRQKQKEAEANRNASYFGHHPLKRSGGSVMSEVMEWKCRSKKRIEKFKDLGECKPTILMSQESKEEIEAALIAYFAATKEVKASSKNFKVQLKVNSSLKFTAGEATALIR
eukprot:TRINITY_DN4533_c0_g2_i6.p1 TRINITY_DN4533_c0_g2~~TRINITY_DN4533_c0_g2_i6.p1  ORF type:complete len:438 (-),score=78.44 TRINITY_DN4533_c0_g2_i6:222-1535(-)